MAASLGVADALAAGARSIGDLAAALGCDVDALYRLLRALAAAGILEESGERRFALTDLGQLLRPDVPGSVHGQALLFGRPYMLAAWGNLEHSIRTGENAFAALHGEDVWAWRGRDAAEQSLFNRAMSSMSAPVGPALAAAYPFARATVVADIGGGNGTLVSGVLPRHPHLRGIVFDQPSVVAEAEALLASAGLTDRTEAVGGSFFDSVPAADVYLLKAILHDWNDEDSIRILRTIRAAVRSDARLLIIELVLGGPNEDLPGKLMDLHMLVMPGGRERTRDEWRELLAAGGWQLEGTRPLVNAWQLIEAAPA